MLQTSVEILNDLLVTIDLKPDDQACDQRVQPKPACACARVKLPHYTVLLMPASSLELDLFGQYSVFLHGFVPNFADEEACCMIDTSFGVKQQSYGCTPTADACSAKHNDERQSNQLLSDAVH